MELSNRSIKTMAWEGVDLLIGSIWGVRANGEAESKDQVLNDV